LKTTLEHLPAYKREELKLLTDLIVEKMQPEFVLLFDTYAGGNNKVVGLDRSVASYY